MHSFFLLFSVLILFVFVVINYGIVSDAIVPIVILGYIIPLIFRAVVVNGRKAGALVERRSAYGGNAIRNCHARKAGAIIERRRADGCNTIRNRHACKAGAIIERIIADAGDTVWNCHARKAGTISERTRADASQRFPKGYLGKL